MTNIFKLTKNELIKIFSRPLIYIMMAIVVVASFGYAGLMAFSESDQSQYYEQSWQAQLNARLESATANANDANLSVEEREAAQFEREAVQYLIDHDLRETSWQAEVLNTITELKTNRATLQRESAEESATQIQILTHYIDRYTDHLEQGDWKAYLTDEKARIQSNPDLDEAMKTASIEVLDLRIQYDIIPSPNPMSGSYGYTPPWQEEILQQLYQARYTLESGVDEYGQKLSQEQLNEQKDLVAEYRHRIEHDNAPTSAASMAGFVSGSGGMMGLISLLVVVIAGTIAATEYTTGTVKLLLIAPAKRWKILVSKYLAVLINALMLLVLLFVSCLLAGGVFFGFERITPFLLVQNGAVHEIPYLLYVAFKYLLRIPELLIMTSIALMLSVIMRHSAFAVGVGAAFTFGGSILNLLVRYIPYDWKRFILQPNLDLTQYFPETTTGQSLLGGNFPPMEGMSLAFSLAVLAVYFICINYITLDSFNRRDVK